MILVVHKICNTCEFYDGVICDKNGLPRGAQDSCDRWNLDHFNINSPKIKVSIMGKENDQLEFYKSECERLTREIGKIKSECDVKIANMKAECEERCEALNTANALTEKRYQSCLNNIEETVRENSILKSRLEIVHLIFGKE